MTLFTATSTPGAAQCCGDCDDDGSITVAELVSTVNRALIGCAATPSRFLDNGDGTISDRISGLMWEKKIGLDAAVDGFELHDADNRYPWWGTCSGAHDPPARCRTDSDCAAQEICAANDQQRTQLTIFRWIEQLNLERFAGFDDWRIPTVEELRVLRAQTPTPPAADPAFHREACGTTCFDSSESACSCTSPNPYWTATELAGDPGRAWRVDFLGGDVLPNPKTDQLLVRAVREP